MATTTRSRHRTTRTRRSTSSRTSSSHTRSGTRSASSGTSRTRSAASSGSRTGASQATRSTRTSGSTYTTVRNQLDKQIDSLRTLKAQTQGPAGKGRPTPATINKFANVVTGGGIVRQATTQAIQRTARWTKPCNSATTALKALRSKFGATIKAVAPSKNGGWLIAASPTWKGRPFSFGR